MQDNMVCQYEERTLKGAPRNVKLAKEIFHDLYRYSGFNGDSGKSICQVTQGSGVRLPAWVYKRLDSSGPQLV